MIKENKITVIVNGRFHAFDYAAELHKLGVLDRLIATMPYSKAKEFGIPKNKYVGFPLLEVIKIVYRKLFKKELPLVTYSKIFNKLTKKKIPSTTDVVISFGGYSKEIFEYNNDKIKILDRGSTHTLENIALKKQAAEYHKTPFKQHSQKFINRELKEYKLADFIMVPSKFVKSTFTKHGIPEHKIILNPYAVSTKKFKPISNVVKRKKNVILFVGQLSPRKGIKVLIDAFKKLKQKTNDAELWLVGSINGIEKSILNEEGVTYFGVLRGKSLQDKFQTASIFCLPSFEEGLALVLTEAKHFELPIVATPNSGVDILFKENSKSYITAKPGDPNDLSIKLEAMLQKEYKISHDDKVETKTWKDFAKNIVNKI